MCDCNIDGFTFFLVSAPNFPTVLVIQKVFVNTLLIPVASTFTICRFVFISYLFICSFFLCFFLPASSYSLHLNCLNYFFIFFSSLKSTYECSVVMVV